VKAVKGPSRLIRRLSYANVVATLALLIAIGGGSAYAASRLVTGKQIAKGTITGANIKKTTLTSGLFKKGALKTGPREATGPAGPAGAAGTAIAYGDIQNNTSGNPVFNTVLSKGFTTVFAPSAGILCVAFPAGVTNNLPLSINPAGGETGNWQQVAPDQCGGTGFEIANFSGATALKAQLTISVP
jgi:hypothetical protein